MVVDVEWTTKGVKITVAKIGEDLGRRVGRGGMENGAAHTSMIWIGRDKNGRLDHLIDIWRTNLIIQRHSGVCKERRKKTFHYEFFIEANRSEMKNSFYLYQYENPGRVSVAYWAKGGSCLAYDF